MFKHLAAVLPISLLAACAPQGADLQPNSDRLSGGGASGAPPDQPDAALSTGGVSSLGTGGIMFADPCGGCAANLVCGATGACLAEGECNVDADCPMEDRCEPKAEPNGQAATGYCVPEACESLDFALEALPPDVFVTMDRSCSLNQEQWEGAVNAVVTLLTTYRGRMRWGLGLFPDTEGVACIQETPFFAVGDDQEDAITALLQGAVAAGTPLHPGTPCVTNLDTAMLQASQDPSILDPSRPGAVILITDGAQYGCNAAGGNDGTLNIISGLYAAGTPMFVVGFGTGVDEAALNSFAEAGGHPRTDPEFKYYQVEDAPTLQAALGEIAGQLVSCVFPIERAPTAEEQMAVLVDGQRLVQDTPDGFSFDTENLEIELLGASCATLQTVPSAKVKVEFSCVAAPTR